jgi:biopolymer transport protein ExbD
MNLRKRLRHQPEVHTGALNDILFILLLFFLIVSTLANPNVIKVSNPKAASDTKAKQTVVVTIDKDQHLFIGTAPVAIDSLSFQLKTILDKDIWLKMTYLAKVCWTGLGKSLEATSLLWHHLRDKT